jgi:hypothetical protein
MTVPKTPSPAHPQALEFSHPNFDKTGVRETNDFAVTEANQAGAQLGFHCSKYCFVERHEYLSEVFKAPAGPAEYRLGAAGDG